MAEAWKSNSPWTGMRRVGAYQSLAFTSTIDEKLLLEAATTRGILAELQWVWLWRDAQKLNSNLFPLMLFVPNRSRLIEDEG
jgi:hypothetical protein